MQEISLLLNIFIVLANIILGLFILLKNPHSATNKIFFTLTFVFAVWTIFNYLSLVTTSSQEALLWIRVILFVAAFKPPLLLLLFHTFPQDKISLEKKFLVPIMGLSLFAAFLALSPFVFTTVEVIKGQMQPNPGLGMPIWALTFFTLLAASFVILIKRYRRAIGVKKNQMLFMLLGFILSFSFLLITNFIMVNIFHNSTMVFVGPFFTIILVSFIFFSIIKHQFLDINLIVARAVSFTILTVLLGSVYALFFAALSSLFINSAFGTRTISISSLLALIMAFSFQPLRRALEKISDKLFYKGGYDSSKLLFRLSSIMSVNIELKPLTAQIIGVLIEQMRVSKGAFVILGEGPHSIYDVIEIGFTPKLSVSYNQLSAFFSFSQVVVFEELEENLLKDLMRKMNIAVIKNLRVKGEVVGLLLLGEKASGEIYSEQDLRVLEILAPEVGVAIQNSQSYDKIKKFNVILSQEVKRATGDLQEANERLKVIDKTKDDFVSIASHELRTPMTAIRSYAWMALHRSDVPLSKTLEKYIARILISTERLVNLVNDMLNISRIESGRIEINPEPVDLLSLVKDIIDEVYFSKSEEKKLEFVVLEKPVPKVFADPEKLRQVFLNLVGNSLKFTPAGGKITFDFFTDGKVVETSVSDTGVGISREDLSKLFHKFSRLDNSYTAAATSGGTGLGLFISRNLVELMHGKIKASSEGIGKGTTFTVALPVASADVLKEAAKYTVKPEGEAKGLEPVAI